MSIITIFSGTFCNEDEIIRQVLEQTAYRQINDFDIVSKASQASELSETKILKAFSSKISVFNKFTRERERAVAFLKLSLAQQMTEDNLLINGFCGMLAPRKITHIFRVCLISDVKSRISNAMDTQGLSESEALKKIHKHDEDCSAWIYKLNDIKDPWNHSLYDIVVPTDKVSSKESVNLIRQYLTKDLLQVTQKSRKAVEDFILAARVEVELVQEGHDIRVKADDGVVTLIIDKHVFMLDRLKEELESIAGKIEGVREVITEVGPHFYKADIYRKQNFELPSKILLVDDERKFVQTLSERLLMRDMGTVVAFDGESALEMVHEDKPEVMILDLRMPGIDGIEVLRRVKETQPEIEVIILTGHGSREDEQMCMELGAFAYLQKPVNIDVLSETLKKANEKIREKMESGDHKT